MRFSREVAAVSASLVLLTGCSETQGNEQARDYGVTHTYSEPDTAPSLNPDLMDTAPLTSPTPDALGEDGGNGYDYSDPDAQEGYSDDKGGEGQTFDKGGDVTEEDIVLSTCRANLTTRVKERNRYLTGLCMKSLEGKAGYGGNIISVFREPTTQSYESGKLPDMARVNEDATSTKNAFEFADDAFQVKVLCKESDGETHLDINSTAVTDWALVKIPNRNDAPPIGNNIRFVPGAAVAGGLTGVNECNNAQARLAQH